MSKPLKPWANLFSQLKGPFELLKIWPGVDPCGTVSKPKRNEVQLQRGRRSD